MNPLIEIFRRINGMSRLVLPLVALCVISYTELAVVMGVGAHPSPVLSGGSLGIIGVLHDLTVMLALPAVTLFSFLSVTCVGILLLVAHASILGYITKWPAKHVAKITAVQTVFMVLPALFMVALAVSGVAYLWLAVSVVTLAMVIATATSCGFKSWHHALYAPLAITVIGGIIHWIPEAYAYVAVAITIPLVNWIQVQAVQTDAPVTSLWLPIGRFTAALATILAVVGVLYVALQPSSSAPPHVLPALSEQLRRTDQTPRRIVFVDGFNTSRATPPWLGITNLPVQWYSYSGFDSEGQPLRYRVGDTLNGIVDHVDLLHEQVEREGAKGKLTLVGVSQGAWMIHEMLLTYPKTQEVVETAVFIDAPISVSWIQPDGYNTRGVINVAAYIARTVTPLKIQGDFKLIDEIAGCTLAPASKPLPLAIKTFWLRSSVDSIVELAQIPRNASSRFYWGAHALTFAFQPGLDMMVQIMDTNDFYSPSAQFFGNLMQSIGASWQLPNTYDQQPC